MADRPPFACIQYMLICGMLVSRVYCTNFPSASSSFKYAVQFNTPTGTSSAWSHNRGPTDFRLFRLPSLFPFPFPFRPVCGAVEGFWLKHSRHL